MRKQIWLTKMDIRLAYLFAISVTCLLSSLAVCENCGYVHGPLATTNDSVVINIDCSQSMIISQHVPLQPRDDATQLIVQLVHCHTMPVGLFANVSVNLSSVTVTSEDTMQILVGTFEGLEMVSELRLLGFTSLKNLSRSLLEPLRNIQILILDGFGRDHIELSYLGSVVQKLSGTPIKILVLSRIKTRSFYQEPTIQANDFRISNASVKELIFTNAPLNYEGSIRQAFPKLTCFYAEKGDAQNAATLSSIWDLMLLSDELKEIVLYRQPKMQNRKGLHNIFLGQIIPYLLETARIYPHLTEYILNRPTVEDCEFRRKVKLGSNLLKISANGLTLFLKANKPLCIQEDNNLIHLDFTRSQLPVIPTVISGLKKLKHLSLDSTGIRKLPLSFLQEYPSLKVLQLSKVDIGNFMRNIDADFFGSCPSLEDIYLADDNLTKIPTMTFSLSVNLQHLDMSKNYLRTFDFDLHNCTRLNTLNLSHNNIDSIAEKCITQLTYLASQKTGGNNLVVDLSYNRLHCLCNTTHLVKWLHRSPSDMNIRFFNFGIYTCLYPNGSIVPVSKVIVDEVEEHCRIIQTLVNNSDCPCDKMRRRRLEQVSVNLEAVSYTHLTLPTILRV